MKNRLVAAILAFGITGLSASAFADAIIHAWECQVNADKTMAEVAEASSAWLKQAQMMDAGEDLSVYLESRIAADVGDDSFNFILVAPDLATWSAWYGGDDPDGKMGDANDMWNEVATCSNASLWFSAEVQ